MSTAYYCNIIDKDRKKSFGITGGSQAAYNKVVSVALALQRSGEPVRIVSAAQAPAKRRVFPPSRISIDGIEITYANITSLRPLRALFAALVMAFFGLFKYRDRTIIIYNYSATFLLLAVLLRAAGRKIILDIEDGINSELPLKTRVTMHLLIGFYRWLANDKVLTVNNDLAARYSRGSSLVIYGAESRKPDVQKFTGEKVQILYSGTLITETGVDLVKELIELISQDNVVKKSVQIHICGFGTRLAEFSPLAKNLPFLSFWGELPKDQYDALLRSADIGLVLKKSRSSMGMTTFPSKIVEYSIGGLLIFSSRVSDVPYLFTDEEVCFTETAEDVLGNLRGVLADIPGAEVRGRRGREKSLKLFSQEEVGTRLREFLK